MSPKHANGNPQDNSLLFHSPVPRSAMVDQKGKILYIQSPAIGNQGQQPSASMLQQPNVNYTTTNAVQVDINQQKELNAKLLKRMQQIESDIQRGRCKEFLKELEYKITMLSQLNQKLQTDNDTITSQIDTSKQREQLANLQLEKQTLTCKITQAQKDIPLLRQRSEELKCQLDAGVESENAQIRELVNELEGRVQSLICENERLGSLLKDTSGNDDKKFQQELRNLKLEMEKIQLQYQNQKYEEDNLKSKCKELERKYNNANRDQQEMNGQESEWQEKIDDLKEKVTKQKFNNVQVQLLIEENQKLKAALNNPENTQLDINDLEDRIQIIINDNGKMVQQIEDLKKKASSRK